MKFFAMKRLRPVAVLVVAVILAGCAAAGDVNSRYYRIPAGSRLVLHQDLKVPAGKARVDIQSGRVAPGLNNYDVGCQIEVRKLGPGVVKADTFVIRRAESSQEWAYEPHTLRFYRTMYLVSETQPDVMKLVCQYWSYPLFGDDIPVAEMRKALGDVASFEFAQ